MRVANGQRGPCRIAAGAVGFHEYDLRYLLLLLQLL
jgi:hypothetical protein